MSQRVTAGFLLYCPVYVILKQFANLFAFSNLYLIIHLQPSEKWCLNLASAFNISSLCNVMRKHYPNAVSDFLDFFCFPFQEKAK